MTNGRTDAEHVPGSDAWARRQVAEFTARQGDFQLLAQTLREVLSRYASKHAPFAIVQARAKAIPSFAGKIRRKGKLTPDPVNEFTDLCGGRLILHTESDVRKAISFLEEHFDIDWLNTDDAGRRLGTSEFGYLSSHYIVSFRRPTEGREGFPCADVPIDIPDQIYEMPNQRSEIQVRTLVQHAWADVGHDIAYKGTFTLPKVWQRKLARVAALLEEADGVFSSLVDGLRDYLRSYGAYMTDAELRATMDELEFVLEHDRRDLSVIARLGGLGLALGDWSNAAQVLETGLDADAPERSDPGVLRDLGIAICRLHQDAPDSEQFLRGRRLLSWSSASEPSPVALCALADTYRRSEPRVALQHYLSARDADAADPEALLKYVECAIETGGGVDLLTGVRPDVAAAIERCRMLIEARVDLIGSHFRLAELTLLAGDPYEALACYARAVDLCETDLPIVSAEAALRSLHAAQDAIEGYAWASHFLSLTRTAKFGDEAPLDPPAHWRSGPLPAFERPVRVLTGGCGSMSEAARVAYRTLLLGAFEGTGGTLLGGGTTDGVAGLAGDVGEATQGTVLTVGYLPQGASDTTVVDTDTSRYALLVPTPGDDFSPLEALCAWSDLLEAGVKPDEVRMLGLGGGRISATEYRMALALGATVGVIGGSGDAAALILADPRWSGHPRLVDLPNDLATVRYFVRGSVRWLDEDIRDRLAGAIHERYRGDALSRVKHDDPALLPWSDLRDDLRESNRDQAEDIAAKLRLIGCRVEPVAGRPPAVASLSDEEVEVLAEAEHGRWNVERLLSGWRRADVKDGGAKLSPYLVGWTALPDEIAEWDREAVRAWPLLLAELGMEIRREP